MSNQFLDLNNYELSDFLNAGTFGKVYKVIDIKTNSIYAAKISKKIINSENKDDLIDFTREVNIISKITYPSILQFIGFSPINFEKEEYPVIITELVSTGSLQDAVESKLDDKGWNETKVLINLYGIASAMAFLHSHGIIHRDLKPENILLDNNLYPKIADFGLSKKTSDSKVFDTLDLKSISDKYKGTAMYLAPEIITDNEYLLASDVYSFSIIIYQLITKIVNPYKINNIFSLLMKVGQNLRPKLNEQISEVYKNLIESCWSKNPDERPTFDQISAQFITNKDFITEKVDKDEFYRYVDYIKNAKVAFEEDKRIFRTEYYLKAESDAIEKFSDVLSGIKIVDPEENEGDDDDVFNNITLNETKEDADETDQNKEDNDDQSNEENSKIVHDMSPEKNHEETPKKACLESPEKSHEETPKKEQISHDAKSPEKSHEETPKKAYLESPEKNHEETPKKACLESPEKIHEETPKKAYLESPEKNHEETPKKEQISHDTESPEKPHDQTQSKEEEEEKDDEDDDDRPDSSSVSSSFKKSMSEYRPKLKLNTEMANQQNTERDYSSISYHKMKNSLFPMADFSLLSRDCQLLVQEAERSPTQQYEVGRSLIEGSNGFPLKPDIGIKYLKKSIDMECPESLVFYCNLLIDGTFVPKDVVTAKKLVKKFLRTNNADVFNLYGKILKDEKNFPEAIKFFTKATKEANNESMFELAKIYLFGLGGTAKSDIEADKYFEMAHNNGNKRSEFFYNAYTELKEKNGFSNLPGEIQEFLINSFIQNEKDQSLNELKLNHETASFIFSLGFLNSNDFIDFLRTIKKVKIQLMYPSFIYPRAFAILKGIKTNDLPELIIEIIISCRSTESHEIAHNSVIDSIILQSTVKKIDEFSFQGCFSLKKIEIPSSVTSISNKAFHRCYKLNKVKIPVSVKSLGSSVFSNCYSLTKVNIPSINVIKEFTFFECRSLREIKIPSSVECIENAAFFGCMSIKEIKIPSSVKTICDDAFNSCTSLSKIIIPSSVTSIGISAFACCVSLESINIPESVSSFSEALFCGCKSLKSVKIPSNSISIEESVFYDCTQLVELNLPESVESIGVAAFGGCKSLKKLRIPDAVKSIGVSAFKDCSGLIDVVLPKSLVNIDSYAFEGCSSLKKLDIPAGTKEIDVGAFYGCSALKEVSMPSMLADYGSIFGLKEDTEIKEV